MIFMMHDFQFTNKQTRYTIATEIYNQLCIFTFKCYNMLFKVNSMNLLFNKRKD